MRLYNTLTKRKDEFEPADPGELRMYVCGPTVYDYIHVGNARPFVFFDTARRYFERKGWRVRFVQNFTDVDDKIIKRAAESGTDAKSVADRFIAEFRRDAAGLNLLPAAKNPRVTDEIPEIIAMIGTLLAKGFAYETDGTVYFDTASFPEYGKLSGKNLDALRDGARVAVEEQKRRATDFVLWKPAKPGEPSWPSPWGGGRPGWHIECSVMAKKYLGDTLDIHAGGEDLIFPHHENETAQSECANGAPFARYWLHNGMVMVDGKKMSKSEGNFRTAREIAGEYGYDTLRFFILTAHYRAPLNFGAEQLAAAKAGLRKLRGVAAELTLAASGQARPLSAADSEALDALRLAADRFGAAMDDDLNTANAVAAVFEYAQLARASCLSARPQSAALAEEALAGLSRLMDVLGVAPTVEPDAETARRIAELTALRDAARNARDYAASDALRSELTALGCVIKDTREGTRWIYAGRA
ncbi:MAG: cysteine--tRNA ligase [Clostridiales bacterium]|jgi:cysteinyl-tRNA synthetase|nr:cysteine--tRNA ligase [Clostridiales bacterium]